MKVAIVTAKGLGDGLLALILAHNFRQNGHDVVTFHSSLHELSGWFPDHKFLPFPTHPEEIFSSYDHIVAQDYSPWREQEKSTILFHKNFDKKKTQVENLFEACHNWFPNATRENGLVPRPNLIKNRFPKRVVIHPMSSDPQKNWPKEKFLKLAEKLSRLGYQPAIAVSSQERNEWQGTPSEILFPEFVNLDQVASYIYESGYLIGNDSGLGHLASNLGIPTLSLFARKSHASLWRPGWGHNVVVTPPPFLIGARLKQKYWKEMLSVRRVVKHFRRSVKRPSLLN